MNVPETEDRRKGIRQEARIFFPPVTSVRRHWRTETTRCSHWVMTMNETFQLSGKMSAWTVDSYSVATFELWDGGVTSTLQFTFILYQYFSRSWDKYLLTLNSRSVLNTDEVRFGPQYNCSNGCRRTSPARSRGSSFLQSLHSGSGAYQSFAVSINRPGREAEQSVCLVRNLEMCGAVPSVPSVPFIAWRILPFSVTLCLLFGKMTLHYV